MSSSHPRLRPASPRDRFTTDAFDIDLNAVVRPAGHVLPIPAVRRNGRGQVRFGDRCEHCPGRVLVKVDAWIQLKVAA